MCTMSISSTILPSAIAGLLFLPIVLPAKASHFLWPFSSFRDHPKQPSDFAWSNIIGLITSSCIKLWAYPLIPSFIACHEVNPLTRDGTSDFGDLPTPH